MKKLKPFDETLWLSNDLKLRSEFSYRETEKVSCSKPGVGVITHPVCPWCGMRTGPDNEDFIRGTCCSLECAAQYDLKIDPTNKTCLFYLADLMDKFDPQI